MGWSASTDPRRQILTNRSPVLFRSAATEAAAARVRAGAKGGWQGHAGAVSGIAVDAVNKTMVTVGIDGLLVFWAFREKRANGAVAVGAGVSKLELVSGRCSLAYV